MSVNNEASGLATPPAQTLWELPESLQQFDSVEEADILQEVIVSYVKDGAQRLEQLRKTATNGQMEEFLGQVHSFKGSSHQMGATQIAKLCESLELRKGLSSETERLSAVDQMEANFHAVSQAMLTYLATASKA
jgi:HPt (histidine-containing phosphotransfer) domain-containing protein